MNVYVFSDLTCKVKLQQGTGATLLPPPGAQWSIGYQHPKAIYNLSDKLKPGILSYCLDYGFLYKKCSQTGEHFAIINSGQLGIFDEDVYWKNVELLDDVILDRDYPVNLYGPKDIKHLPTPPRWTNVVLPKVYDPDGEVIAIWSPSNSELSCEEAADLIFKFFEGRKISNIITAGRTVAESAGAAIALSLSVPLTYVVPRSTPVNVYHHAATIFGGDVIYSPAVEQTLLQFNPKLLALCDHDEIPDGLQLLQT